jgi:HAD superfamily hydrolase (TIGR01484 family)
MLLASDLDGTLIPSDDGVEHRAALRRFRSALARRPDIRLAYVTGRRKDLAEAAIRDHGLPGPDFLACDVGTSIYLATDRGFEPDPDYAERMVEAMGGTTAEEIRGLLAHVQALRPQSPENQSDFKASYEFGLERRDAVTRAVLERLGDRPLSVVVSHDPYRGTGLLDVLPAGVAKHTAIAHLRTHADVDHDGLYYAGDSGNDLAAMLDGYRVIVVGNAPASLKSTLREEATKRGILDRLYFAEAPYAGGVLEGCRHWGLFDDERAQESEGA